MTGNQQVRFLGGGRLAASPPTYLLPTIINTKHCHSERSEESQMFSRSVVFNNIFFNTIEHIETIEIKNLVHIVKVSEDAFFSS